MLPALETNVFTALRHHSGGACPATDDRSDSGSFAAAGDGADDGANTRCGSNLGRIVFGRVASFDATFRIDLRVFSGQRSDFDEFGVKRCGPIVSRTDLIES